MESFSFYHLGDRGYVTGRGIWMLSLGFVFCASLLELEFYGVFKVVAAAIRCCGGIWDSVKRE